MKKIAKILNLSLAVTFTLSLFQSCDRQSYLVDEIKQSSLKEIKWQEQLTSARDKDTLLKKANIQLISFEYIGDINSQEDIEKTKKEIKNDQNLIPAYSGINDFKVVTLSELKRKKWGASVFTTTTFENSIDTIVKVGLGKVRVNWKSPNKNYTSICLVSKDKGVIYENLLSNVVTISILPEKKEFIRNKLKSKNPRIKTSTENSSSYENGTFQWWSTQYIASNYWGTEKASARCHLTINLKKVNNIWGFESFSTSNTYYAESGYSADAKTSSQPFVSGTEGHLQLYYGVMVGTSGGFSLGAQGYTFSLPTSNSVIGETGENYYTPSNTIN